VPALTDYLSRRGEILVLILVVVASIGLMMLSAGAKGTTARSLNDAAVTPVQTALTGMSGLRGLRGENDSLRARLAAAELELAALKERGRATSRLEEMLGFRERSRFQLVAARVVAREAGAAGDELKIDRGAVDGLRRNLAVITPDGLVGKLSRVDPGAAFVRPLTGRHCRASARLTRTRSEGVLEWTPDRGLQLTFLPYRSDVAVGDEVISTGLGGVFPRGIRAGTVSSVGEDAPDGSRRVSVDPVVDFGSLEEVFVILSEREGGDDPAGDAGAASPPAPGT
jgi:rod shape-determining protein MreC